jgi:hypothetical protein
LAVLLLLGFGFAVLGALLVDDAGRDLVGALAVAAALVELVFELFVLALALGAGASGHLAPPEG